MGMKDSAAVILDELTQVFDRLSEKEFEAFLDELIKPRRIFVIGVGRMMISLKAWVKRMAQLGLDVNYFGSETEGPLREGDLLVVASSSGESAVPKAIVPIARERKAHIVYIGCTADSAVDRMADSRVLLTGRTKFRREGEFQSVQPMSTLVEQQLYLLGDMLSLEIMKRKGLNEEDVRRNHANLE
ncbi:MAG TPA: SIS domain-containing protein [Anaerovoracaceae bacterium]|nr:SIS domain-containing protein [Anaerovoracaceae bacterium]